MKRTALTTTALAATLAITTPTAHAAPGQYTFQRYLESKGARNTWSTCWYDGTRQGRASYYCIGGGTHTTWLGNRSCTGNGWILEGGIRYQVWTDC